MSRLTRPKKQARFLELYAALGNITQAAKRAGIERRTHHRWFQSDLRYAENFRLAAETAVDTLEAEAWRRAVKGIRKPVYQGGKLVGHARQYSDTLLIFLLNGAAPHKYRYNHAGPLGLSYQDYTVLSDEELQTMKLLLTKLTQKKSRDGQSALPEGEPR